MTSPQEQYAEAVRTSQQAVVGAVESWTKSVQSAFGQTPSSPAAVVDPNQVIDQIFDFAEKMLEVQRDFAKNMASTAAAAGETARQQAESAGQAVRKQAAGAAGRKPAESAESAGAAPRRPSRARKG
jgi:acetyl-CoA carboxylase carboxyltransferase component